MNKIFVTSDLHFSHGNILKYENRPFLGIEHMNEQLIKRWNNVVSKHDKVFVLGDVSFANKEETKKLVSQLNGKKILIMGNHDRGRSIDFWRYVGFDEVSKYPIILYEHVVMSHEPPTYFNDATPYAYLYGHVHSTEAYKTITKDSACVCTERWNYTPVELSKVLELMSEAGEREDTEI